MWARCRAEGLDLQPNSPCSKYGLCSETMALITSGGPAAVPGASTNEPVLVLGATKIAVVRGHKEADCGVRDRRDGTCRV